MVVCVIVLMLPAHSSIIGRKRSSFSSTNTLLFYLLDPNLLNLSSRGGFVVFEGEKWKTSVRRSVPG